MGRVGEVVEAPGTAPGSATLIPQAVYRHSRLPDGEDIGCGPRGRNHGDATETDMPLTDEQRGEIAAERAETRPTRRVTVPALEEILYEAVPVLDHGFVRVIDYMGDDGDRAGGAGLLRARHEAGQRGPGPHQLPDAASAYDPVRNVRDQVPRQIADLCRPAVDPAPHRQRQRVQRAVLDPRQRVLYPGPGAPRRPGRDQPPGPGFGAGGGAGPARPRPVARGRRARLCRLR